MLEAETWALGLRWCELYAGADLFSYDSCGYSGLAAGCGDVLGEVPPGGYHRMGQRHILDLDGVEYRIGSRLSVEPEAARPAGPKRCLTPVRAS